MRRSSTNNFRVSTFSRFWYCHSCFCASSNSALHSARVVGCFLGISFLLWFCFWYEKTAYLFTVDGLSFVLSAIFTPRLVSDLPIFAFFHFSITKVAQRFFFATVRANTSRLATVVSTWLNNWSLLIVCHAFHPPFQRRVILQQFPKSSLSNLWLWKNAVNMCCQLQHDIGLSSS